MPAEASVSPGPAKLDFAEFRELYREYFLYLLRSSDIFLSRPEDVERFLSKQQINLFQPLVDDNCNAFNLYRDKEGIRDNPVRKLRAELQRSKPGAIGCHYRSIGLGRLRNSQYFGTGDYWSAVDDQLKTRGKKPATRDESHFDSLLALYFKFFDKSMTVNQQIFNTNHPLGPIGFEFIDRIQEEKHPAALRIGPLFSAFEGFRKLTNLLAEGFIDDEDDIYDVDDTNKPLWFVDYIEDTSSLDEKIVFQRQKGFKAIRTRILNALRNDAWSGNWDVVQDFIKRRLPRNGLADAKENIIVMFQSSFLYGLLAGRCIYTFPTTVQPGLPTCGWTVMAGEPVSAQLLDFLQRVSETIYGELIGGKVSRLYQQSFRANIYNFIQDSKNSFKTADEFHADIVLATCLADSPIPLRAANTFLEFAKNLPEIIPYEGKTNEFIFALTHQDFLETFIDRLPANVEREKFEPDEKFISLAKSKGLSPGVVNRVSSRPVLEFFYNDPGSIGLACHGMRLNSGERSSPEYVLFFVYPPFDPEIVNPERFFSQKFSYSEYVRSGGVGDSFGTPGRRDKILLDAIKSRQAIVLMEKVRRVHLLQSNRLVDSYERNLFSEPGNEPEDIAEALTVGNKEMLVLIFEKDLRMKLYFDGVRILESRLLRWRVPVGYEGEFEQSLYQRAEDFYRGQDENTALARSLSSGLTRFLDEASRRRKGLFIVFLAEKMPQSWYPLDVIEQEAGTSFSSLSLDTHLGLENRDFWRYLQEASSADGAIVVSQEDASIRVDTKIRITLEGREISTEESRRAFAMKGLQARFDYPGLRSFGTKHNTAYECVFLYRIEGFAAVVSEDGPVTLFFREQASNDELRKRYGSEVPEEADSYVKIVKK